VPHIDLVPKDVRENDLRDISVLPLEPDMCNFDIDVLTSFSDIHPNFRLQRDMSTKLNE
jgi:hypothetical protein